MDARLAARVTASLTDPDLNVAQMCRELGVSRSTFYKYQRRFAAEGVDGFYPRSRRPHRAGPGAGALVEEAIVRARKQLLDDGRDAGARSVRWWLEDHDQWWAGQLDQPPPIPSVATLHRVLTRRGQITPQPRKRPRRSYRRFERGRANDLWQMDGFEARLADGTAAVIIQILDDCTRTDLACRAVRSENAADVWDAFTTAVQDYGLPAQVLTDNGTAFSGRRRGWQSAFETAAAALGVHTITSRVAHPQTCGKVERAHRTTLQWLHARPATQNLDQLQALLDQQRTSYNNRRHQALHGLTPNQQWAITPLAGPADQPLQPHTHITRHTVSQAGTVYLDSHEIGLGKRQKRQPVTAIRTSDDVAIFTGHTLLRTLTLDRTRTYQPQTR